MKGWGALAVALALVAVAVRRAAAASRGRRVVWTGADPSDAEYLARILMIEAASGARNEWAAIAWVAVNRARRAQSSVRAVVASNAWFGSGASAESAIRRVQAPSGSRPDGRTAPPQYAQYPSALSFATALLEGRVPNPIGPRRHFVHPQSLPICTPDTAVPAGRVCVDGRLFPRWSVSTSRGGSAEHEPIQIGRGVFS